MLREIKCKKNFVESSEAIASQSRGTLGPGESRILHVEFFKLCDTSSVTIPSPKKDCAFPILLTVASLIFVQLMTDVFSVRDVKFIVMTDVFSVRNVKIVEVVNNTIIVRNARNNMNKLT